MRKLIVITLVFALASVANATYSIIYSDDGDGTFTLDVVAELNSPLGQMFLLVDTSEGTITGGTVNKPPAPSGTHIYGKASDTDISGLGTLDGPWLSVDALETEYPYLPGTYFSGFDLTPLDSIYPVVYLYEVDLDSRSIKEPPLDTVVVPEPATVCMLGLGSLVLLKKRKKAINLFTN